MDDELELPSVVKNMSRNSTHIMIVQPRGKENGKGTRKAFEKLHTIGPKNLEHTLFTTI